MGGEGRRGDGKERGRRGEEGRGKGDALQSTAGVPMSLESELNASAEMIAPALPHAADMPCAEARKRVGKTSAG